MASLERTAYPKLPAHLSTKELHQCYSLSEFELEWLSRTAKSPALTIGLAVLLKTFQQLHYFPSLEEIRKRAARTVLTGMCYSVGSVMRQGSSSLTRLTGQSAMPSRTWRR